MDARHSHSRDCTRCAWVLALLLALGTQAWADPYYTVTDLGPVNDVQITRDANGQQVLKNTSTGVTYAFPSSLIPLTPDQMSRLPGVNGVQGATNPIPQFFQMRAYASNVEGTVVGTVPSGQSRANPWDAPTFGYAVMGPNGQYSGFVGLTSSPNGEIAMNNQNLILYYDFSPFVMTGGWKLLNLNTHVTTPVEQLLSPDTIQKYGNIFTYMISDNGSLFGDGRGANGRDEDFLLTPPGLPAPVPVPEPTTLATLALGLGGLAYLRRRA